MAEVATTILDEQEVTAAVLNEIAIDLGATSFNYFGTEKFGARELNEITKALVNPGILLTDNSCKPSFADGILTIATGTIIFDSGAKIKIKSPVQLSVSNGTYIYALNNTTLNEGEIIVSPSAPSGDSVMIAQISQTGELIDKRKMAKAKVQLPTEADSYSFVDTVNMVSGVIDHNTVKIPITGVSKIYIKRDYRYKENKTASSETSLAEYNPKTGNMIGGHCLGWIEAPRTIHFGVDISKLPLIYGESAAENLHVHCSANDGEYVTFKYTSESTASFSVDIEYTVYGGE